MISIKNIRKNAVAKKRSKDTEYLFASSYLRSIEEKGVCRESLSRMLSAPDYEGAMAVISEVYRGAGAASESRLCDAIVNDAYKTVDEVVSVEGMYDFMRYPYDANNIKTAIKCAAKGISTDGLMFACASLDEKEYPAMAASGDFSSLPSRLAEAARLAADEYAKTGDPQSIDLPIDKACIEAMLEGAEGTGSRFIKEAIRIKIDGINLMTAMRISQLNKDSADSALKRSLASGGKIPAEVLASAVTNGEDVVKAAETYRAEVTAALDGKKTLGELERALDNLYLDAVYEAKKVSFGCEVPFAYLVSAEYNSKNARIILAGKRARLSPEAIGERMRLFYV